MNLIFMRHGEASDNVKELISDKEIYWSILTDEGIKTVEKSVDMLPESIDVMYVSPFPRTIETAHYVYEKYPIKTIIDDRIREIYYGKYSHQENNEELDGVRKSQIAGDYFVRFGESGENKYDIEKRLTEFLTDVYNNNDDGATVLIVSHGSVTSYMKRILGVKSEHIKKGCIDIFNDVSFDELIKYDDYLKQIYYNRIKKEEGLMDIQEYIGKELYIKIDRPFGSKHPKHGFIYPINYGYVPDTISGDGEELDAYLLGVFEPVEDYTGKCIAIIHRTNDDDDDKLVVVPIDKDYSDEAIEALVEFQEEHFKHVLIRK